MSCNNGTVDSLTNTLDNNLGRDVTVFCDSGDCFTGVLSDVSDTTCTLVSTGCSRCPASQRINTIPLDKISCLKTSQK